VQPVSSAPTYDVVLVLCILNRTLSVWVNSSATGIDCNLAFTCTPQSKVMWEVNKTYSTRENVCERMAEIGLRNIFYLGDSYMRHIAAGVYVAVTRNSTNYDHLSMKRYEEGLKECYCHGFVTGHNYVWTDVTAIVSSLAKTVTKHDVVLISYGNHQLIKRVLSIWNKQRHRTSASVQLIMQ
jgi:hypothetical protein